MPGLLLVLGAVLGALSKWYLVWLAQKIGGSPAVGAYGYFLAFATPLFVLAQLGLHTVFLSKTTSLPWRSYVVLRWAGMLFGSLILVIFLSFAPGISMALGLAVLLMKVCDSIVDLETARVQYEGWVARVAAVMLLGAAASFILSTVGALLSDSLTGAVLGGALASLLSVFLARRYSSMTSYVSDAESSGIAEILKASLPVTGAQLLASLLLALPTLFLGNLGDLSTVGVFVGASYVLTFANILGASLSKVVITPWRKLVEVEGSEAIFFQVRAVTVKAAIVALPVVVVFVVWGSTVVRGVYGPEFALSRTELGLLAIASFSIVLAHIQSVGLTVLNRYYSVVWSFLAACIISVLCGLLLSVFEFPVLIVGTGMAAAGALARATMLMGGVIRGSRRA